MYFEVYDIAVVPLLIFLLSLAREVGVPKKLIPLLALILGVVSGIVYFGDGDIKKGVLIGLLMASSAVGVHSGQKNLREQLDVYRRGGNKKKNNKK